MRGLLMEGLSVRGIAASFGISERTAGNHVAHIWQEPNVKSPTAAVIQALPRGLVPASPGSSASAAGLGPDRTRQLTSQQ